MFVNWLGNKMSFDSHKIQKKITEYINQVRYLVEA